MIRATRSRRLLMAALPVIVLTAGCYDPPVTDAVLLALEQDGRVVLSVDTEFKQGEDLESFELDEIRRVLDLYSLGRDPWLRGFGRAGATGITHELSGDPATPRGISRRCILPSLESIVSAMPDAIANFRLLTDAAAGVRTLRIVHIDPPESLRSNRRRIESEVETFARLGYRLSEAQCDLYDYLAGRMERRHDTLQALEEEARIEGLLTPGETVLVDRTRRAIAEVMEFGEQSTPPILASMSFGLFDHGFCLRLPPGTVMIDPGGFISAETGEEPPTWCAPRLTLGDLIDDLWPEADPSILDEATLTDPARIASAPFTCRRHPDEKTLVGKIWGRMLPRSQYELKWGFAAATRREILIETAPGDLRWSRQPGGHRLERLSHQ